MAADVTESAYLSIDDGDGQLLLVLNILDESELALHVCDHNLGFTHEVHAVEVLDVSLNTGDRSVLVSLEDLKFLVIENGIVHAILRLPLDLKGFAVDFLGVLVEAKLALEEASSIEEIPQAEHIVVIDHEKHTA